MLKLSKVLPIYSRQSRTIIKLTFVYVTIVLVTFVRISNISAVADPILIKLKRQLSGTILQAQAPAGMSLALFPNYPATWPRPGRVGPT